MTYTLMSLPFAAVALLVFGLGLCRARRFGELRVFLTAAGITLLILLVLTAIFDNIMMAAGLFDYGTTQISGIRVGRAPLEDFLYPLAATLLLSGLWRILAGAETKEGNT